MKRRLYKNNKGSSLVIVLIAIAFVSILTAVILSATAANYRLRVMNNNSKKTFYSAETALEEVYAGLGEVTCDIMEISYLQVAQNLSTKINVGGNEYTVKVNNDDANAKLKELYYEDLRNLVVAQDTAGTLGDYLTGFLSEPANAYVSDYGSITYDQEHCRILIEDVVVQYKEENYDYFSNVATDIELKYPNKDFDFISNTKSNLETFLEFSIIAMDGVDIGNGFQKSDGIVAGGLFAGNDGVAGGININDGSTLNVGNSILSSTIISAGDVNVYDKAKFNFGEGKLWCVNINAGSKNHGDAAVIFGNDTKAYVADDLNIAGNDCSVQLGPDYNGYGLSQVAGEGNSSAIVINGKSSILHAPSLNRLVLAGRAYLNFEAKDLGTTDYMTGDSISIKGNQEIFLVPMAYMDRKAGTNIKVTNPIKFTDETKIIVKLNDFFAYELLDSSAPYVAKNVKGVCYLYLNFKSVKAQQEYVKCILSEEYLNTHITNKGPNWQRDREQLYIFITNSMKKFVLSGAIDLGYNSGAKVYASGNLYEIGSADKKMSADNTAVHLLDTAELISYCQDKSSRYTILKSYLYDIGSETNESAYATFPTEITIAGIKYNTGDATTVSIYDRTVDTTELAKLSTNYINERADGTISAVIVEGNYSVPEHIQGGLILGYNCDISINSNFEGLVITNGKVYVYTNGGETITNGVRDVASRILDEDVRISKYFYAYQMDTDNTHQISIVDVNDLLSFNNWRKNYAD